MSEDRLQKILARAGFGSRRHVEEMIGEGRVTVNGRVVTVGDKADLEHDAIKVDGKRVHPRSGGHRYLLLNKPRAVMSTIADPEGRPTVLDLVPLGLRKALVPVGRLDFLTEGLILLTDDGDLAQRVAHPRYGCTKTYEVKVRGLPDERSLEKLRRGIVLEGQRTRPASIDPRPSRADSDNTWWTVELGQGRTRQIREMFQRIGHPVMKLRRIAIGPLRDPDLPLGELRELSEREVEMLRRAGKHRARAEAAKAKAAREGTAKGRAGKPPKAGKAAKRKTGKAGRAGKAGKGKAGAPGKGKTGARANGPKRASTGGRSAAGAAGRSRERAGGGEADEAGSRSGGRTPARRGEGRGGGGGIGGGGGRAASAGGAAASGAPSWFFGVGKPGKGSKTASRGRSAPRDEAEGDRKPARGRRSAGETPSGRPGGGKPRGARPAGEKAGGGGRAGAGEPRGGRPGGPKPRGGKPRGGEKRSGKPAGGGRSGPSRKGGSGGRGGGRR